MVERVEGRFALRAVVLEDMAPVAEARAEARGGGLDAWLAPAAGAGGVEVELQLLKPGRAMLLVQRLPGDRVEPVELPARLRLEALGPVRLCRFHEGPVGRPLEHRYCQLPAATRDGYCRLHASSWKALYERCAQGSGQACMLAERLLPRGLRFAVYALDYGGSRLKIGMTQEWRLLSRVAEQPHASAAVVAGGLGLREARGLERRLARSRAATEGGAARLGERLRSAARLLEEATVERLSSRLASLLASLGLQGSYRGFTVLPTAGTPRLYAEAARLEPGGGWEAVLLGYWAGLLLALSGGRLYTVPKTALLHLAARGLVEGPVEEPLGPLDEGLEGGQRPAPA